MSNFKIIGEGEWKPSVELTWNDPPVGFNYSGTGNQGCAAVVEES